MAHPVSKLDEAGIYQIDPEALGVGMSNRNGLYGISTRYTAPRTYGIRLSAKF